MTTRRTPLVFLCLTLALAYAHADEGMWSLWNLDPRTAEVMKELGLELSPSELYNPDEPSLKDAVVDFGDFCSGVVVSPEGLIFTNHHCGLSSIQRLSTPEDDILDNGFVAHTHAEERPVEGLFVRFLERTIDCTDRVEAAMQGLTPDKLDSVMTSVEAELTGEYPERYCVLKSYYGASRFYASVYKVYDDVRLVLTPPQSLGKFGGDTDNWMWPRQTCDFSVFRVYASAEGEPSAYSEANTPLATTRYAPVSIEGYKPGDFCMTIGYPGSTSRYLSSYGVTQRVEDINVSMIYVRAKKQEIWKRWMDSDRVIAIKYASKYAASSNYWKNSIGMDKAVRDLQVVEEKRKLEQILTAWSEADEDRRERFAPVLPALEQAYTGASEGIRALGFLDETFKRGIEITQPASILASIPPEPDSTELAAMRERLRLFYKDYEPKVDQEVMAALLEDYRSRVTTPLTEAPEAEDSTRLSYLPSLYETIDTDFQGDCSLYAEHLFSHTLLTDSAALFASLSDSTRLSLDPAVLFAQSVIEKAAEITAALSGARAYIRQGENQLTQALLEREQDEPHYSDANFSMRLSYGYVEDYTAEGIHYNYYTNVPSLLSKAEQQEDIEDYRLEPDFVDLFRAGEFGRYADRDTGDLHLCFLSNNDITGGNSGSPMFNSRGELLGLAFDGNWEAMSGDISFHPDLQRCIGVDIRFVLFIIDRWAHADNILSELGL